ncbi:MAG: hypothetical protein GXP33_15475 [Spirochaetes bacterium]|nr:hypothetical protein [Spirochaetota bacterium]
MKGSKSGFLRVRLLLPAGILFILLFGCATAPQKSIKNNTVRKPPNWVFTPPPADNQYMYFTGSGTSRTGDIAEGERIARGVVLDAIMRYLGVDITSKTTAVAKGSLDSFKTDVTQTLTSRSSGRIAGLKVSDRWVEQKAGEVTVYLLVKYSRVELLKEKRRIEKLFKEKIEAVSEPEKKGDELAERKSYYKAVIEYIEASAAAFKSGIDNADIKFERTINKAKAALSGISIIKLNDNLTGFAGKALKEPFKIKVVSGTTEKNPGIPDVSIKVTYSVLTKRGRKRINSVIIKTDKDGYASFLHPVPQFVGSASVVMMIDITPYLGMLESVPSKLQNMVDGLSEVAAKQKVVFHFNISSFAKNIATGIVVADLDASGKPIEETETENGLLGIMTGAGFKVSSLPVEKWKIIGKSDNAVISMLSKVSGGKVKRVVFGYGKISGYEQDKETVIVKVTGTVKVVDLSSGDILLSVDKTKSALGSNVSTALSTAFYKLGEDFGKELINKLR